MFGDQLVAAHLVQDAALGFEDAFVFPKNLAVPVKMGRPVA